MNASFKLQKPCFCFSSEYLVWDSFVKFDHHFVIVWNLPLKELDLFLSLYRYLSTHNFETLKVIPGDLILG